MGGERLALAVDLVVARCLRWLREPFGEDKVEEEQQLLFVAFLLQRLVLHFSATSRGGEGGGEGV